MDTFIFMIRVRFLPFALLLIASCSQPHDNKTRFVPIPATTSHIDFRNEIKEDEDYNILTYEYLYNGAGVAVGDVDGDGLPDLFFTANMQPDHLYLNKGGFQFTDITAKAGITGRPKWKTGAVMADVNGDGRLDIYVCYSGPGADPDRANELYINLGNVNGIPQFKESAKEFGLDAPGTYTTTVAFFDMDHDGDLDLFMVNHADMFYNPFFNTEGLRAKRHPKFGNRLYRNDNGHFTDISEQAHIDGSGLNFGLSVAISDLNNDGWPDIYVTNDYDERDFCYLNNRNGTFREVLTKATGHISEFAMGSDIADYNNDGLPDIAVLDMLPEDNHRQKLLRGPDNYDKYTMRADHGFGHQQMRNTLQLNNGLGADSIPLFSEVGQLAGMSNTDWSWAPLFADFDNDGWKDLFISNGIYRDMTNLDFVKYTSGYSVGQAEKLGDKLEMWRLVKDMPSTKLSNYMFHNNGDLTFNNATAEWGLTRKAISNGAAYVDLDNDGDLDLVVNTLGDAPLLYRNYSAETHSGHWLRVRLKGDSPNTQGIGARLVLRTAKGSQYQEQYLTRGFQSSVDPIQHFGCGPDSTILSLTITWPSGNVSSIGPGKTDTTLTLAEKDAAFPPPAIKSPERQTFTDITAASGIQYAHQPSDFVDFKISPLLPYQPSHLGPCLAKGDVNGDGLEDVFIGGTTGQDSRLYLQTPAGKFIPAPSQPWNTDKGPCNTAALFFDADGDGDLDLYLVSGGADNPIGSHQYQDRLFENAGNATFRPIADALPAETSSGGCVRAADYNKDGLPDLFVGGKLVPGFFPRTPESLLLKNTSRPGHLRFELDNARHDSTLSHPGMIADAQWVDLNKDTWPDLVVAGPFTPITIFENQQGRLVNTTAANGLGKTNGWWTSLLPFDIDNDGNTDLILGNLGLNTQFKASEKQPLQVYYGDFSGNQTFDPILTYYIQGKSYPYASRDELFRELPALQKKFGRYADYADARIQDILTPDQLATAGIAYINQLSSIYLHNDGNHHWTIHPLPNEAQLSCINAIAPTTIDGQPCLMLAGNLYPMRAQMGPLDAAIGMILKVGSTGRLTPLPYSHTGLHIRGDTRSLIEVKGKKYRFFVAAGYGDSIQVLRKDPS